MNVEAVGTLVRRKSRYGWVILVLTILGFYLIYVQSLFLSLGIYNDGGQSGPDYDINQPDNQPPVSVTASPGFISLSSEILDNGDTVQIISHSSVSVDVVVKAKDGRDLSTYFGLMPGESLYFEYEEPCAVTAVAS